MTYHRGGASKESWARHLAAISGDFGEGDPVFEFKRLLRETAECAGDVTRINPALMGLVPIGGPDGPLVPLPARQSAPIRVVPPFPLTAYRIMIDGNMTEGKSA